MRSADTPIKATRIKDFNKSTRKSSESPLPSPKFGVSRIEWTDDGRKHKPKSTRYVIKFILVDLQEDLVVTQGNYQYYQEDHLMESHLSQSYMILA